MSTVRLREVEGLAQSHGGKQGSGTPHWPLPSEGRVISLMRVLLSADLGSRPNSGPFNDPHIYKWEECSLASTSCRCLLSVYSAPGTYTRSLM